MAAYFSYFKEILPRAILVGLLSLFIITVTGSIFGFFGTATPNNRPLVSYKAESIVLSLHGKATPDLFGGEDFRAIAFAAVSGETSRIDEMLQHGLPIDPPKDIDITPLYWALGQNNLAGFVYLVENGASLRTLKSNPYSVMHQLVALQNLSFLKAALQNRGNPNQKDDEGLSLLFMALKGDWFIFKALIDNGADMNDWYDSKPLVYSAIENGQFKKAWLLLENGADYTFENRPDLSLKQVLEEQLKSRDQFSNWQNKYLPYLLEWFKENKIVIRNID